VTTATYLYKVGNRLPRLRSTLLDGDGAPIDLTAASVTLRLKLDGAVGLKLTDVLCTIVDAAAGVVEYPWAAGDLDTAGTYRGTFGVTIAGLPMTVPASGHVIVIVEPQLS
jgi:hypothetical protein